jgi:hypothetical protein
MHLETLNGQPASILGLAGSQGMDTSCAAVAFEAGVNYFFFYDLSHENLLDGLKPIVATHREQVLMATGSDERDKGRLRQYLMRTLLRFGLYSMNFGIGRKEGLSATWVQPPIIAL